jgi:Flp pilus assembly pilin Flp
MKKVFKQHSAFHWINDQRGAAAIMVTVIMLVVATLVVSTTALIGLDDLEIGYSAQVGEDALLSAESCVEEAFVRLSRDTSYSGGSLDVGNARCTITVTGTPCGTCTISAQATQAEFTRTVQVGVSISGGTLDITSWQEQ